MNSSETSSGSAERQLFFRALEKPAGKERTAFLDGACADNPALRRRLEVLLQKFETLGTFLQEPAVSLHDSSKPPPSTTEIKEAAPTGLLTEKAGDRIGRYKLLQQIGEGGCGVVYMAEQEEPVRRRVALKVIRLGMDTRNVIARFEAERQALALMDHPNIAKVLDAGSTDTGRPYFVMELVRGIKITEYCDQNCLPTKQRLELFVQICRAIQHAHQKGIIHRDIKPSNLLITLHDGIPVPKVIDFGIAKATTDQRLTDKTLFTRFEQFIGTPAYMSPEQAEMGGLDIDTRTDIYSLGVLLYELLTGKTPFDSKELLAAGLEEMRRTIREKEPVRPSTRLSTMLAAELTTTAKRRASEAPKLIHALRGDLDWIVMKALEKDRTRRYETANALAMDLQRHLNNETVTARPPSQLYRFHKLVRRNKLVFAAVAAVAAVFLFGIVASMWQAARATKASKQAVANAKAAKQAQAKESAARTEAEQNLYESLVREARATRIARRPGYRERVFELLLRARTLLHTNTDPVELRCEASQCLGDFVALNSSVLRDFAANIQLTCLDFKGHLAAFSLEDSTVVLCEIPSGQMVASLHGEGKFQSLCFSADSDQLLALQDWSWIFRWRRSAEGKWPDIPEKTTVSGAFACLSSASGLYVAVDNPSAHEVQLLDPATRARLRAVPYSQEIEDRLTVALSHDNRFLAIGGDSASNGVVIQIWDLPNGTTTVRREPGLALLFSLNFSDDAQYLSCLSNTGGRIYAGVGWQPIVQVRDGFDFYGPGEVALSAESTLAAWPFISHNCVRLLYWSKNENVVTLKEPRRADQVAFAAGDQFLLTSGGRQARLYQLNTREKFNLARNVDNVTCIAFSPKDSAIASIGHDKTVRVWDTVSRQVIWTNELPGQGEAIAYSPDGNLLATGVWAEKSVLIWDAHSGKPLSQFTREASVGGVWSVQFSLDGQYLAAAGDPDGVRVWALKPYATGTPKQWVEPSLAKSFTGSCGGLVFSRDSRRLAFVHKRPENTHELNIWELGGAALPRVIATNLSFDHRAQAFTPDGRFLLNTDTHRAIIALDPATGKESSRFLVEELSTEELVDAKRGRDWGGVAAFWLSPDGTKLAVIPVSRPGVDIWDPRTGRRLYSLPDESGNVWFLAWSADNQKLAVSRCDGDIAVWKLQEVEQALASLGLSP
jgi:serine/threonine protein kinase/WD40 repeat protein